ncbi:hypothetical protein LOD99_7538 [Oopsacas minuta]|uniref:Uncharacterized protein n=1 Tax=Oopsacas minuta TaxID=111878 RepID=A0AAV7JQ85_9METZ|nr:hypothetical protein LOD99_7538 [Oopsacas minuta]
MTNTPTVNCGLQNGTNCTTCLENVMCYWCDESSVCSNTDFFGLVSTTCPVQDLFITQCVLNGLYSIIVIVAAVLLLVGVFLCICITCCICCCWCCAKKRNYSEDKQQLQMDKIKESKEAKRIEREQKRAEIRNKYM